MVSLYAWSTSQEGTIVSGWVWFSGLRLRVSHVGQGASAHCPGRGSPPPGGFASQVNMTAADSS